MFKNVGVLLLSLLISSHSYSIDPFKLEKIHAMGLTSHQKKDLIDYLDNQILCIKSSEILCENDSDEKAKEDYKKSRVKCGSIYGKNNCELANVIELIGRHYVGNSYQNMEYIMKIYISYFKAELEGKGFIK